MFAPCVKWFYISYTNRRIKSALIKRAETRTMFFESSQRRGERMSTRKGVYVNVDGCVFNDVSQASRLSPFFVALLSQQTYKSFLLRTLKISLPQSQKAQHHPDQTRHARHPRENSVHGLFEDVRDSIINTYTCMHIITYMYIGIVTQPILPVRVVSVPMILQPASQHPIKFIHTPKIILFCGGFRMSYNR